MSMIEKPADIIHHIIGEELGKAGDDPNSIVDTEGKQAAINAHLGWQMAFSQSKVINSKKLIEGIAKETKLFPFFKGNKLSFNSILDVYTSADFEIKDSDVISYKFDRTKIEDIKTKVILNYYLDYSTDDFKKSTESNIQADTAEEFFSGYSNAYYGIEGEQGDDPIEVRHIRRDETIEKLQRFLLSWYCNQHNTCKIKLPLRYLYAEVGDITAFPTLLGGDRKAYGEDYSLASSNPVIRNGQQIFPYWMIMGVNKTLEYVELDLIQMHSLEYIEGEPEDYFPPEWRSFVIYVDDSGLLAGKRVVIQANVVVWDGIENATFTWDINPPLVQGWDDQPVPFMFHGVEYTTPAAGAPYTQQGMDLMELCPPIMWGNDPAYNDGINEGDRTYTISCTVTDSEGATVSASQDITIPGFFYSSSGYIPWFGVGVHSEPNSGVSGWVANNNNWYFDPVHCRTMLNFPQDGSVQECMVTTSVVGGTNAGWAIREISGDSPDLWDWVIFTPPGVEDTSAPEDWDWSHGWSPPAFRLFISTQSNTTGVYRQYTFRIMAYGDEGGGSEQIGAITVTQEG